MFNHTVAVVACAMAISVATVAHAAETPPTLEGVTLVDADQVRKLLDAGKPVIDTRIAAEYAEKTIKGARNVPYKEKSEKKVDFDPSADSFDLAKLPSNKDEDIVFFCNSGECWKSYKASVVARKAGYKHIHWYRAGFPDWHAKGLPTQ